MKFLADSDVTSASFWLRHPDSTQAAVHLALQWLAYVYPASEQHLHETLKRSLSYTDETLVERWRQMLENQPIEQHVEALRWLSETLSRDQVPFLVESCWRLLLEFHEMPTQVPLALRLMGRILNVSENRVLEIGERVQRETQEENGDVDRSPLLPEDPRYLDRIEWRLFGVYTRPRRSTSTRNNKDSQLGSFLLVFFVGFGLGIGAVSYLVWGPPQFGRHPVPLMSHLEMDRAEQPSETTASEAPVTVPETEAVAPEPEPETEPAVATVAEPEAPAADPVTAAEPEPASEPEPEPEPAPQPQPVAEPEPETASAEPEQPALSSTGSQEVLMMVTASVLNVRAEPSTGAPVIMKLGEGARVWVDPEEAVGFWARVRVAGELGYASGQFLAPAN